MKNPWKKIKSKIIYESQWLKFREDEVTFNGKETTYSYIDKLPGAVCFAMTDDNQIYLVGQWRYLINKYSIEVPMGTGDEGEDDLSVAKRELQEETGITAKKWEKIGEYYFADGICNQKGYIFLAKDLDIGKTNFDDTEEIHFMKVPINKVEQMIKDGEIFDAPSIAAFYQFKLHLGL